MVAGRVAGQLLCSPRLRGWSRRQVAPQRSCLCSPRLRGWSRHRRGLRRMPRGAPRACGDGPWTSRQGSRGVSCSPRLRGWSPGCTRLGHPGRVLPAHCGDGPRSGTPAPVPPCAPRACGDGPSVRHLRHASAAGAPRACGDGPFLGMSCTAAACSPRLRGWSLAAFRHELPGSVLPAPAGMVPAASRGDSTEPCSPRMRGWSRDEQSRRSRGCAPRACGDGPSGSRPVSGVQSCSPRLRGMVPAGSMTRGSPPGAPRVHRVGPITRDGTGCYQKRSRARSGPAVPSASLWCFRATCGQPAAKDGED